MDDGATRVDIDVSIDGPLTAWLGVVSADHVARGVGDGIAQIGHGKKGGLARMRPGDLLVYYSPRDMLGGSALRAFTAGSTTTPMRRPSRSLPSRTIWTTAGTRTGATDSAGAWWS